MRWKRSAGFALATLVASMAARGEAPRGFSETETREPCAGHEDDFEFNPGGLAVIRAEANSRDVLFEAMRRREVYGTSGPRHSVRFFGEWDLPEDLCEPEAFAATGYSRGVPMGADLPPRAADRPIFAVPAYAIGTLAATLSFERAAAELF